MHVQVNHVHSDSASLDLTFPTSTLSAAFASALFGSSQASPCSVVITAGLRSDDAFMTPLHCKVDPMAERDVVLGQDWHNLYKIYVYSQLTQKPPPSSATAQSVWNSRPIVDRHRHADDFSMSSSMKYPDVGYILSPFTLLSPTVESISILLKQHGIYDKEVPLQVGLRALYHHILHGLCFYRTGVECAHVAGDLPLRENVVVNIIDTLSSFRGGPVYAHNLREACVAVGIRTRFNARYDTVVALLQSRRDSILDFPDLDLERIINKFQTHDRSDLLAIAAAHGLSYFGPSDNPEDIVLKHLLSGECGEDISEMLLKLVMFDE
ncbi:hypothetical protein BDN72DRAFT_907028 [Pluteus cervinus]|uniref:Uncharacterized protein n=1 Tax=Pluteus cervinus TaxID=181527 RepID=A0ACD2ZXZ5_9AGAR|nr:hypothetical protein BDN72DRAFT_907028 [Pluteus cervinus]